MKFIAGKLTINEPQAFVKLTSKGERERERIDIMCTCADQTKHFPSREDEKKRKETETVECSSVFLF